MKISRSQTAPAHTSAGRRPAQAHTAQYGNQHAAAHSSSVPAAAEPTTSPAPAKNPGASSAPQTGAATTEGVTAFIPDLATGAENVTDSLQILAEMASATLRRLTPERIECALLLTRTKHASATAGTSAQTERLARMEQEFGEGPLVEAIAGNGTVAMNRVATDFRWAQYRPHLQDAGFDSVLSLRLALDEGASAALAFFASTAHAFPLHVIAGACSFAEAASRGLRLVLELEAARTSASDLQSALESRTSIDIACGVIMAQNRCSYNDAIAIIAKASSHRNVKLRKVAEGILENLPGGAPRTHFER